MARAVESRFESRASRPIISRFSRPVSSSSTAAYCPVTPMRRRTSCGWLYHVEPGHRGRSGIWLRERGENAHGGGLAGAVRAEHAENLSFLEREIEATQRAGFPEPFFESLGEDNWLRLRHSGSQDTAGIALGRQIAYTCGSYLPNGRSDAYRTVGSVPVTFPERQARLSPIVVTQEFEVVSADESSAPLSSRQRIVATARALFVERGYASVSMQQIADATGLRKASLYHHFKSKEALFAEVMAAEMDRVLVDVRRCARFRRHDRRAAGTDVRWSIIGSLRSPSSINLPRSSSSMCRSRSTRKCTSDYGRWKDSLPGSLQQAIERGELEPIDPHHRRYDVLPYDDVAGQRPEAISGRCPLPPPKRRRSW